MSSDDFDQSSPDLRPVVEGSQGRLKGRTVMANEIYSRSSIKLDFKVFLVRAKDNLVRSESITARFRE